MTITPTIGEVSQLTTEKTTGASTFSTSTTAHELTVPAGKIYEIQYLSVDPDNSSTISARLLEPAGDQYQIIMSESATTGFKAWPQNSVLSTDCRTIYLSEGHQLSIVFGTAQSTTSAIIIVFKEWYV